MKKLFTIFLVIISVLCLISCSEQEQNVGKQADFTYDYDGISKIYLDTNGNISKKETAFYTYTYEYNENGAILRVSEYSAGESEPFAYTTYEYDEQGNLLKSAYYHTGNLRNYTVYENDNSGKCVKSYLYEKNNAFAENHELSSYTVYEYDGGVFLTKSSVYDTDNVLGESTVYEYHANGKPKKETLYNGAKLYMTVEYDENGNTAREEIHGYRITINEYNSENKIISSYSYYEHHGLKSEEQHLYEYDKSGRRISEIQKNIYPGTSETTEYTFRENGRFDTSKTFNGNGILIKYRVYHENGVNPVSETFYTDEGIKERVVEYDGATITKTTYYNHDGSVKEVR